jgi:serine/threonine protein kinase
MTTLKDTVLKKQYFLRELAGSGGMADVYKAWDQSRGALLAVKVLNPVLAGDYSFLEHFREEAKALASLQHPNIVRFYSLERDGDIAFIVMDYIEGVTLREEMNASGGQLAPQRILEIMRGICAALNYAHELGYIHCDIKPANILINKNGAALVADFGIARLAGGASPAAARGGTPGYMSPEQIRGESPTRASDIYALGVLLFELLSGGKRPFNGQTAQTSGSTGERIRWEQTHLQPPLLRQFCPDISPELERIVLSCLEIDPAKRYPNVKSLLSALEQPLQSDASRVRAEHVPGSVAPADAPEKQVVSLPAQYHRAKKTWVWLLIVIPVIVLMVLIAGGVGGSPSESITPFKIRTYNSSMDKNADCIICQVPDWEEPTVPGSYQWDVTFPADTPVLLQLGWCAVDQPTLDATWPLLKYDELTIDGYPINTSQLTLQSGKNTLGDSCYAYTGILVDWSRGRHQYTQVLYYSRTLSDGRKTYEAGKYIYNFTVVVP